MADELQYDKFSITIDYADDADEEDKAFIKASFEKYGYLVSAVSVTRDPVFSRFFADHMKKVAEGVVSFCQTMTAAINDARKHINPN